MSPPTVFVSYSHDSPAHEERVLRLAERLCRDGIEVRLDQYVPGAPAEGWPRWMLNQLDAVDFVLVVCTATYYRRFRGHEEPGKGKGADWEGVLITQEIYDARSRTLKFVPVLFAAEDARSIPEPLRVWTHYALTSEEAYESLYDFLLGQGHIAPAPLGEPRRKEPRRVEPLSFGDPVGVLSTAGAARGAGRAGSAEHGRSAAGALAIWQEKLAFLQEQEAVVTDASQKFALRKQVEEARAKIREHGGEA
jgi:hypothetical protein